MTLTDNDQAQADAFLEATLADLKSLGAMADSLEKIVHSLRQCAALASLLRDRN